MDVDDLRAFMKDLVDRHTLRYVEDLTGVNHEAIRKFVERKTEKPHPRSIRAFTALYWRERGLVFVAEAGGSEAPRFWASELRAIFADREQALADVAKIFELAGRFPDELPASAKAASGWWMGVIGAEYGDELPYRKPPRGQGRGGKKSGEPK